jgi:hypothetical protein
MFYPRKCSPLEIISPIDQNLTPTATVKRTASFVCLNLNDIPNAANDQPLATISGTLITQPSILRTSPQRRLQRNNHRQQQQQTKSTNGIEIDQVHSITPAMLTLPNLMEIATRTSPLPNLTSNNMDVPMTDSSNKYSYETQIDSNGVNHHRLQPTTDNHLRSYSKTETPILRISPTMSTKMPTLNNNGNHKKLSSQKTNNYFPQPPLSNIETILRERSLTISNENVQQPDSMDRVNHILKQLYLPTEKNKKSQR